jgi:thiol-disulfide isomerase/thioredoxin
MIRNALAVSVALVLALTGRATAEGLSIGDPAPKLEVKEFVKGEPVKNLEKGKTYVVEFWATWCGPCRVSIPHLTKLQKEHKDVIFVGVSVWERDQSGVKPFVEKMGEQMDYRVALDDVPAAGNPNDGKMALNWMKAAEQGGIPTAFIVNDGKIAWIGHPMEMEKPLAKVVAGKWDLTVAAADFKKAKVVKAKMQALFPKLIQAQRAGDNKALLAALDEAIKDEQTLEPNLGSLKFQTLVKLGDAEKTAAYGKRLVDDVLKDNAQALNALAWGLVEKPGPKPDANLMKLALRAAQQADKLAEEKDGAIADTLAKAYFENGEAAKALETQERAVKLAKGNPQLENDKSIQERLDLYKKAVEKK